MDSTSGISQIAGLRDLADPFWQKKHLLVDSRKLVAPADTLYFALTGQKHDGHTFVGQLYEAGVRAFVICSAHTLSLADFPEARFHQAESPLAILQALAEYRRRQFSFPVLAVTGSNGKTIVKEWLYQLMAPDLAVVKSPKSYNSQIGVPLSVWQMQAHHQMGLFEAGISKPGEMEKLRHIIRPNLGIFTNIGPAHDEGFASRSAKLEEKMRLFEGVDCLVCCADHEKVLACASQKGIPCFTWSVKGAAADLIFEPVAGTAWIYREAGQHLAFNLPFADRASVENALHCFALLRYMGYAAETIVRRLVDLENLPLRLSWKQGKRGCALAIDAYNNDKMGLAVALDFLQQQAGPLPCTLILSDILEAGEPPEQLYQAVAELLSRRKIGRLVGVGPVISAYAKLFTGIRTTFFATTEALLAALGQSLDFEHEAILLKGARQFTFERIAQILQQQLHGTRLEIDLEALAHNLNVYKSLLKPETKIMVMVKAFAYGAGSFEVARLLEYQRVDYLAVAYADEGVALREKGIRSPIMVMNPAPENFGQLLRHNLEPEIFSLGQLRSLLAWLSTQPVRQPFKVHIAFDTGMHRLGFEYGDMPALLAALAHAPLRVVSAFTHLAAADDPAHAAFTQRQLDLYAQMVEQLSQVLPGPFLKHVLNSAGVTRYPQAQYDMVRLGIGLHGWEVNQTYQYLLRPVASLKTTVSQVKQVPAGETIGYGRAGKAAKHMQIATIAIGYADGFSRAFSQGRGKVLIGGALAPVVGNVCMDMCMVDVSGLEVQEGDEVVIFGPGLPPTQMAAWAATIPYEVLAQVSERVKRLFFE